MRRKRQPPFPSELQEQIALFAWASLNHPRYPELALLYHINNNSRSAFRGRLNKRAGLKRGFPDLCLPVARPPFNSLYIELKRPSAAWRVGAIRKEQAEWLAALILAGNAALVAYGAEDAARRITAYLDGTLFLETRD